MPVVGFGAKYQSLITRDPVAESGPLCCSPGGERVPFSRITSEIEGARRSQTLPPRFRGGDIRCVPDPVSQTEIGQDEGESKSGAAVFKTCKFCMIYPTLIPIMIYNAQVTFERDST
jgi:hypothetical protein